MKKIIIPISKGQYINDLEPFKTTGIPSDSIIHKTITGCGITTFEIRFAKHNSIIIEPTVPVIKGKFAKQNKECPEAKILGVHQGVDVDDIKIYLLNDTIKYKKIITTPEGFVKKVLKAFEGNEEAMINDFFLLYDECDKIVSDVPYRKAIAAPIDTFFKFKRKALVSATTLPYSDTRFNDFTHYHIKPDYDYSRYIEIINTNNIIASLEKHLSSLDDSPVCIFLNSTNGIHAIIKGLDIKNESAVFCGSESVIKLLTEGFRNADTEFQPRYIVKYNFFTSRFFSAFDIELDFEPNIIVISDVVFAKHSTLDPYTECVQIPGRFRNGIGTLTHITNYNDKLESMARAEALSYIEGSLFLHEEILKLLRRSNRNGRDAMLNFFEEYSPMSSYYSDGKRNTFMVDAFINDHRVNGYYNDDINLKEAYNELRDHFDSNITDERYEVSDFNLLQFHANQNKKDKLKRVAKLLDQLTPKRNQIFIELETNKRLKKRLTTDYPLIAEAVRLIGLDGLQETGYIESKISKAVNEAKKHKERQRISTGIYTVISENNTIPEETLLDKLNSVSIELSYTYKVSASLIEKFFEARRSTRDGKNVWIIGSKLPNA